MHGANLCVPVQGPAPPIFRVDLHFINCLAFQEP